MATELMPSSPPQPPGQTSNRDAYRETFLRHVHCLLQLGYDNVALLAGGVAAWRGAGYELFSGMNVPSKAFGEFVEHHDETPRLTAEEIKAKLDAGTDMVILDSRPMSEYRVMNIPGGIEITSVADIPARGSGLGSSSSFTVGVLHALHAFACRYASAEQLARESCEIEIDRCGEPIGRQDQYAAAFGGFNFIQFYPDDSVSVEPIICKRETLTELQENILVFYTGITRSASALLKHQQQAIGSEKSKQKVLRKMVDLAHQLNAELQKNNLDAFGEIIHENWLLKRSLAGGISTPGIDRWYDKARKAGAIGGKLLGAGSGGFLMFYAPAERHDAIARHLKNLCRIQFRFEPQGSKIIFVHD